MSAIVAWIAAIRSPGGASLSSGDGRGDADRSGQQADDQWRRQSVGPAVWSQSHPRQERQRLVEYFRLQYVNVMIRHSLARCIGLRSFAHE